MTTPHDKLNRTPTVCYEGCRFRIDCRMIHGALWYGDHPRNILSSCQPQASELTPAVVTEGHWLETTCRDTANEGHYAALLVHYKFKEKDKIPGNQYS